MSVNIGFRRADEGDEVSRHCPEIKESEGHGGRFCPTFRMCVLDIYFNLRFDAGLKYIMKNTMAIAYRTFL
jgi:hypothetical protein